MWPQPSSVDDLPLLDNSVISTLSGDTLQVKNVLGFFSENYRDYTTGFYRKNFQKINHFIIPPIRLNHPPEYAYTAIKDQTQSTYLEEYVYPLRNSLYVNGFEPFYENGEPKFWGSVKFVQSKKEFSTKVTIRYYPSPIIVRLFTWILINISIYLLWKIGKKVIKNA